jgi:hypothetical protein
MRGNECGLTDHSSVVHVKLEMCASYAGGGGPSGA